MGGRAGERASAEPESARNARFSSELWPRERSGPSLMKVILAKPRGFCAGVERAIEIVERALEKYGAPVYVRHEIVHNRHVVDDLRAKGARFVDELEEIPAGGITVFS